MQTIPSSLKPKTEVWRPELTRLPRLTVARRIFRTLLRWLCKLLVLFSTRMEVNGLENYPRHGPALIVFNHLGDPDIVLLLAALPEFPEITAKIEVRDIRRLRLISDWLGAILVHRGQPDRRAISAILEAFRQERRVLLAPEARESVSGALEVGTGGAAFLAMKAEQPLPIVPVSITGSEFRRIENDLKRFRRTPVTLTIGKPFLLPRHSSQKESVKEGTRIIMETLARQLPENYRGMYSYIRT